MRSWVTSIYLSKFCSSCQDGFKKINNNLIIIFKIFKIKLEIYLVKSSHQRCSIIKGVLRNFAKFTGKHLCQSLFFNKVKAYNFIKKEILAQVFPVIFAKFLRTHILQNTSGRLLLFSVKESLPKCLFCCI